MVQQDDYKLRKLKDAIAHLTNDQLLLKKNANNPYYVQMASEYCEDILKITDFTKISILKCREVIYNLITLLKTFKGSPAIMIHLERLLVISKEKYEQLLKYYKDIANTDTLKMMSKEELKNMAAEKNEKLKNSLSIVSEVRATVLSGRRSKYNPNQVINMNRGSNDILSDSGKGE